MPGGEHPEQLATTPPKDEVDFDLQGLPDLPDHRQREATDLPALDQGARRDRHAGHPGEVCLSPAQSDSHPSKRPSECEVFHVPDLEQTCSPSPYGAVTSRRGSAAGRRSFHEPAVAALTDEGPVAYHRPAAQEDRADRAAQLEAFVRRVIARVMEVGGAKGPPRCRVEEHEVGVAADLDCA